MQIQMRARFTTGVLAFFLFLAAGSYALAQSNHETWADKKAAPAGKSYVPSRTAWGDPDFQGVWSDMLEYLTPFQRPVAMGNREFLNDEEYAKKIAEVKGDNEAAGHIYFDVLNGLPDRRTSLIIDPADGRMPPFTPEGKRRVDAAAEAARTNTAEEPGNTLAFGVGERCISRTLTGAGAPRAYDNTRQIFQTKDYVVILYEEIHDARIIPLDGRAHLSQDVHSWLGNPRGHWEGNTLVVETTNFRGRMTFNGSPGAVNDIPVSDHLRIVERFTRIDTDTIDYTTTVDDPETFVKPWTFKLETKRDPTQTQVLEFGCHEGNRAIAIGLASARADEAKLSSK